MPKTKKWIVTASGDRPLADVANELTTEGFTVDSVLNEIGSITGSASDEVVPRLRKVTGVADISPDAPIDIGPPDSSVTW